MSTRRINDWLSKVLMCFDRLRLVFGTYGARRVFLPRLPLPRLNASGSPLEPSGTRKRPSTFDVVKVRRFPVSGSTVNAPLGLKFGRSPPPPFPFESTPV